MSSKKATPSWNELLTSLANSVASLAETQAEIGKRLKALEDREKERHPE